MPDGQTILSKKIDEVNQKADQILTILMGDVKDPDKPGLVQRVKVLEDEREAKKENNTWLARAALNPLIAAVMSALTMLIIQAIYYYTAIKPLLDKMQMEELLRK